ncbi:helix-turn-helix domain-containing protein [Paenibacillus sp. FSL H7-0331]|uniref:helix-turn-helix domain-containing protein n=1 Tax=Paenibacillus sp. FSL H7-0331 TaxID=1920421 RepID=UPI0009F90376|nr:helix-turn-helix transcriptional regulator [Paenibacillus sp. FSL H7-0331]
MKFSESLRTLRKARGISQSKLATELDIPESNIRRYESQNDTPNIERLKQLGDYFKVSIDKLLGFEELSIEDNVDSEFLSNFHKLTEHNQSLIIELVKSLSEKSQ